MKKTFTIIVNGETKIETTDAHEALLKFNLYKDAGYCTVKATKRVNGKTIKMSARRLTKEVYGRFIWKAF